MSIGYNLLHYNIVNNEVCREKRRDMKGQCKHEEERNGFERWCKLFQQYLAGQTCEDCEDYEEGKDSK